ncbi:amidohydrolase [Aliikangiella sp. IMCC44359]|uniref:amidohydrolase n=1 Tax=Aliikangiella sp. IMCC44359 TaxID=3459125 RepID=UPI00403AA0ED
MSTLTIAAVQYNIQWLDKAKNLANLTERLNSIKSADLIVLPETFSTGFGMDNEAIQEPQQSGMVYEWMQQQSIKHNAVIAGSVFVEDAGRKRNRFYWIYPNGETYFYDKRHLFRLGHEEQYVNPGTSREVFEINQIRILPQVCYDLRFPVWSRNRQDYDLMVNVANWPIMRRDAWDTLLKARAMENQVFVVGVNRVGLDGKNVEHSGGTAIYDFLGRAIVSAEDNQQQIIQTTIDIDELKAFRNSYPMLKDADDFEIKM